MDKKIVTIVGSPRRRGNCARLAASFERRMKELGYQVDQYDACRFSPAEWTESTVYFDGSEASDECLGYKDLMLRDIQSACGVVFFIPVYIYGMPAQMTAVINTIASAARSGKITGSRKCALVSVCAQKKMSVFNGVKFIYEHIIDSIGWENGGELLLTSLWKQADADKHHAVDEAYAFADKFAGVNGGLREPDPVQRPVPASCVIPSAADGITSSWLMSGSAL
ncbi:MAG: flavodoxin family protein [Anaerovoracaceae bacterium]|jgi:multimeric flavodoxin WrbA